MTSQELKEAAFAQETSDGVIALLTIDHDDLASPIRVARNEVDVDHAETFSRASTAYYKNASGVLVEAAVDELRYTYDSDGNIATRIEESAATNLALKSNTIADSSTWSVLNCTATANDATGPDGETSAVRVSDDSSGAFARIFQEVNIAGSSRFMREDFSELSDTNLEDHSPVTGQTWAPMAGLSGSTMKILASSGRLYTDGSTMARYIASGVAAPSAEYEITADITVVTKAGIAGFGGRAVDANNGSYYMVILDADLDEIRLYQRLEGSENLLDTYSLPSALVQGNVYTLRLSITNANKRVYFNLGASPVIDSTDNTTTAAGNIMVAGDDGSNTTGLHMDTLVVVDKSFADNTSAYCYSLYVKQGDLDTFDLSLELLGGRTQAQTHLIFDFSTETFTVLGTALTDYNFEELGNGWYRLWMVLTNTGTGNWAAYCNIIPGEDGAFTFTPTGYCHVWGAQLEVGSAPTSYIPTVAATATRAADVLTVETYTALGFDVVLPPNETGVAPNARLVIDNVSRVIVEAIRSISSPATVSIKIVRVENPDSVESELLDFQLRNVTYDVRQVTGDLMLEHFLQEPYPAARFNPARFPGGF